MQVPIIQRVSNGHEKTSICHFQSKKSLVGYVLGYVSTVSRDHTRVDDEHDRPRIGDVRLEGVAQTWMPRDVDYVQVFLRRE